MKHLVHLGERWRSCAAGEGDIVDFGIVPAEEGDNTVLLTSHGILTKIDIHGARVWQTDLNEQCESPSKRWRTINFLDPEIVCLSQDGPIVTVVSENGAAEMVGDFDNGIEASGWSNDSEVLALVTQTMDEDDENKVNSVLLTMNAQWEILAEVEIERFVPSLNDDASTRISLCWRPDGRLIAVSCIEAVDEIRRIRVYDRETLELTAVGRSEDGSGKVVPNLSAPLTWASSTCSNILAAVQRKGKTKQQVVFFEPNGLRHREFLLRDASAAVEALCFNVESDLLGVTLQYESRSEFQLWHRSNYHWYLKKVFTYSDQLTFSKFHPEDPYRFFVGLKGGKWREYQLCWDPSLIQMTDSDCVAFAIDGARLNRTPLHQMIIPPPMYASSIEFKCPIRELALNYNPESSTEGVAGLSDGSLFLINRADEKNQQEIKVVNTEDVDISSLRQFIITATTVVGIQLLTLCCGVDNQTYDTLTEVLIENGKAKISNAWRLDDQALRMVRWSDKPNGVLVELVDGTLIEFSEGKITPSQADPLLEPCPWISGVTNPSPLVVGLSSRLRLYCHDRLLCDAASSFQISTGHSFLVYATAAGSRCTLRFLPLGELQDFDPLMGSDENHLLEGYESRHSERGARLVAILPKEPTTILQMTRGNMEGIFPRALVLPHVMKLIDTQKFNEAFKIMRRQKVDLNLIVDLDPHKFIHGGGVEAFVEQVKPVDYLNLFISCQQDFDVTQRRHPVPRWFLQSPDKQDIGESKVNQVCQKIRSVFLQAERDRQTAGGRPVADGHFLLPILSTFAKENPPRLMEALSMIREKAIASHQENSNKHPLFSEIAQGSIKYLAFLADYELLFKTALGMYDFDLARSVARNSQMDPKVYLALLKRLRSLPEHYGKYETDIRLERYESALTNLYNSGNVPESLDEIKPDLESVPIFGNDFLHCLNLIESYGLHRLGLKLFTDDDEKRQQILLSLGNVLLEKKHCDSALSVFLSANPPYLEGAKEAAKLCGDWRFFFTISFATPLDEGNETIQIRNSRLAQEIASEIAAGKASSNQRTALLDAARILLDYGNDIVGAVDMLIQAEQWSEARRIALLHMRNDLVRKTTDAAISFAHTTLNDLDDMIEGFKDSSKRYVMCLKARKAAIQEVSGLGEGLDETDETGSMFSMGSQTSNASVRSNLSSASLGSTTSISSVISVGNQSSFTMTSQHDINKHKSKFNKIGQDKRKGGRKKKGKIKIRAGSEEELKSLVSALKANCVQNEHSVSIAHTILFLSRVGKFEVGHELYKAYKAAETEICTCQLQRIESNSKERADSVKKAGMEGVGEMPIFLPCEKEVDALKCPELPYALHELFSFY